MKHVLAVILMLFSSVSIADSGVISKQECKKVIKVSKFDSRVLLECCQYGDTIVCPDQKNQSVCVHNCWGLNCPCSSKEPNFKQLKLNLNVKYDTIIKANPQRCESCNLTSVLDDNRYWF